MSLSICLKQPEGFLNERLDFRECGWMTSKSGAKPMKIDNSIFGLPRTLHRYIEILKMFSLQTFKRKESKVSPKTRDEREAVL